MNWLSEFLISFWSYVAISAPALLIGFTFAGLIHVLFPMSKIKKWLGKEGIGSILRAALIGVPLPLCSCSVIPTAVTLKKSGASNGATSAFLIATPESGIDSIAMTYSMMDLPMTIIRPIAAFVSALVAGLLHLFFNPATNEEKSEISVDKKEEKHSCCSKGNQETKKLSFMEGTKKAFSFSFKDLAEDLAFWMLIGLISGALINIAVPEDFFANISEGYAMFAILLVGIPFYICASASTPIAASLMMKGLNPGAALLFLLVGPATNMSNILVLQKYIGKKGIMLNIIAIVITGLAFAFGTNFLYEVVFKSAPIIKLSEHHHDHLTWWNHAAGIFFLAVILRGLWVKELAPRLIKKNEKTSCH